MDNASKALIMAGAILIAVAIVGIGIYIFSASNSLTNNAVDQIDTLAVQMFNSTFTNYAKHGEIIMGNRMKQFLLVALDTDDLKIVYHTNEHGDYELKTMPTGNGTIVHNRSYRIFYEFDDITGYITSLHFIRTDNNGSSNVTACSICSSN